MDPPTCRRVRRPSPPPDARSNPATGGPSDRTLNLGRVVLGAVCLLAQCMWQPVLVRCVF
eukprot:COSAG03_NODE_1395_length_4170_cov_27.810120_1_plen_59_part_10